MEWNTKWDWENIFSFGSKASESPKKQQQLTMDRMMLVNDGGDDDDDEDDDGEINRGPLFNLSDDDDGGHNSSSKSSISASTDSSSKDGMHTPSFRLTTFESSSPSYVGSGEPLIGLKLGKRTYFENTIKSSTAPFTVMPTPPSSTTLRKNKSSSGQNSPICCQVEGCISDLSQAKEYHRKHKVCDSHSKYPKVIVGGIERRFCQQCSRFHSLCEFDEKKRSCRRRLSDHNARRRKPQQETIQFNSARLSSPFYDELFLLELRIHGS